MAIPVVLEVHGPQRVNRIGSTHHFCLGCKMSFAIVHVLLFLALGQERNRFLRFLQRAHAKCDMMRSLVVEKCN